MTDWPAGIDSKFRLITIAAKRCEQLHRGARPRFNTNSKKWAWVALEEVKRGLVEFELLEPPAPEVAEDYASGVFLEGEMGMPIDDGLESPAVPEEEIEETEHVPGIRAPRRLKEPGEEEREVLVESEEEPPSLEDVAADLEDDDLEPGLEDLAEGAAPSGRKGKGK
jgi:DNA-directed RNA polymerase omega subunit